MKANHILYVLALILAGPSFGQKGRFDEEVQQLASTFDSIKSQWSDDRKTVVFVGSSSIRMWNNVGDISDQHNILNTGFGGSTAKDLLGYMDLLILDHDPDQVFIYEGDNDIFMDESVGCIMRRMRKIVRQIKKENKQCEVVIISAKPSVARWKWKDNYLKLNRRFERWANRKSRMAFADVWFPMMKDQKLDSELFIEDNLHMNAKGYKIWTEVLQPYLLK